MRDSKKNGKSASPSKSLKLIVIVPAYDESDRIGECIRALKSDPLHNALKRSHVTSLRVFVVDDGSKDGTGEIAKEAGADRVIRHRKNLGLGAAVRTGIRAARDDGADIMVKFDADLQHSPSDIPALIVPILEDCADLVYGNRFSRIDYRMPALRAIGNRVFRQLMRWLTGWPIKDSQPGIFAANRDYLEEAQLYGDYNYTQQILLDAYLKNMRFDQVDVSFAQRTTGQSFISLKYPFRVLPQILMALVAVKPMKVFFPIGGSSVAFAVIVAVVEFFAWLFGVGYERPIQHVNLVLGFGLFGMQILFLGLIAQLVLMTRKR